MPTKVRSWDPLAPIVAIAVIALQGRRGLLPRTGVPAIARGGCYAVRALPPSVLR
jgi:hypothetical protein